MAIELILGCASGAFSIVPLLAIDFIAPRATSMLPCYAELMWIVCAIIDEAMSSKVITVGTTIYHGVWWRMRTEAIKLGLVPGFHPSSEIQRAGTDGTLTGEAVIEPGDNVMVWCDYSHIEMGMWTDIQHMRYVLEPGETTPPAGLVAGLRLSNQA